MNTAGLQNLLIPLHATHSAELPIICIPGAGASVTAFMELIDSIGGNRPIYGLQPLGLDLAHPPHTSVEAAAAQNLALLAAAGMTKPLHLVGHSHGGLVAFEMATRMQKRGLPVASLTVVDSEPPDLLAGEHPLTDVEIYREFVDVFEKTFDTSLGLADVTLSAGNEALFLRSLHEALVKARAIPGRSHPDMLRGSLVTFSAARRVKYCTAHRYTGPAGLVLVGEPGVPTDEDMRRRMNYVAQWKNYFQDIDVWHGPGHHFSILRQPHVDALAKWWIKNQAVHSRPAIAIESQACFGMN